MPHHGSLTALDLVGIFNVLRVKCDKCDRHGRRRVSEIIRTVGLDGKLTDWLAVATRNCPRRGNVSDPCGATLFLKSYGSGEHVQPSPQDI